VFDTPFSLDYAKILDPVRRFCPRGEVSASADEGGIPVRAFFLNGWHHTFTPLTTSWSPPPMGENFILNRVQRFCPRGEVSASADEGGILVRTFLPNDWHNTFTPLTTSWSPPPLGGEFFNPPHRKRSPPPQAGNFILNPMQRFCPHGEVSAPAGGGYSPPPGGIRPKDGGTKKTPPRCWGCLILVHRLFYRD